MDYNRLRLLSGTITEEEIKKIDHDRLRELSGLNEVIKRPTSPDPDKILNQLRQKQLKLDKSIKGFEAAEKALAKIVALSDVTMHYEFIVDEMESGFVQDGFLDSKDPFKAVFEEAQRRAIADAADGRNDSHKDLGDSVYSKVVQLVKKVKKP